MNGYSFLVFGILVLVSPFLGVIVHFIRKQKSDADAVEIERNFDRTLAEWVSNLTLDQVFYMRSMILSGIGFCFMGLIMLITGVRL